MDFPNSTITRLIASTTDVHHMNGAYGREIHISFVERSQALTHMIDASVFYLSKLSEAVELPNETLDTQGKFFVEARAR